MRENQVKQLKNATFEEKKNAISNFGIYELRGLARALGVPSPTTKKRDFLIDAILELLENQDAPQVQKSNKGRPFKKLESIDNILSIIGDNGAKPIEIPKAYSYEDLFLFAQEVPVFEYHSEDLKTMSGVLRIVRKTAYFIDLNFDVVVFVPADFISNFSLSNGDFIEVNAYKINESNQHCTKSVISINQIPADKFIAKKVLDEEKVLPNETNIGGKRIVKGGRNVICVESPIFLEEEVDDLFRNLKDGKVLFLGVNLCQEDALFLKKFPNFIKFTTESGKDNISKNFNKIIDAINLCERISLIDAGVTFVIYDIENLANAIDLYFSSSESSVILGHSQQSGAIIEKLMSLAGMYASGKHCTEVIISNKLDQDNPFTKNHVLKISKKIVE